MLTGQTRLKLMHIYTLTFRIRALTWIFSKIVRSSRFSATPNKTKKAHWYTTLFKPTWEITNATFEQVQIFLKSEGPIAQTSQESFASEFVQNSEYCTSVTCNIQTTTEKLILVYGPFTKFEYLRQFQLSISLRTFQDRLPPWKDTTKLRKFHS